MSTFFAELKRRNVFKVAIAYAIVAWLLIQVMVSVEVPLHLPDWADSLTIILLIIGFPIAIILAWAYELTPEGIRPTRVELHIEKNVTDSETAVIKETLSPRLAILPFENLSPDPDNAFFTDGLHEEILSTLTNRAPGLGVVSRTTMMSYRRDPKPLAVVVGELHASHVLEGSVRREGDQMRLTLQLIDGRTDNHLWAQKYDRTLTAALTLQSEVAEAVADQLAVQLAGEPGKANPPTTDVIAYDLYLKGVTAIFDAKLEAARSYLDQALARDPGFAIAYQRRAMIYSIMINSPFVGIEDPVERNRLARLAEEDARKALALDPDLGYAHSVLAGIHEYHWRWTEARVEHERALELSPNDPSVNALFAIHLALLGNQEDEGRAWQLAQHATELDPKSSGLFSNKGMTAYYLGKLDDAAESYRESIALNPTIYGGWGYLMLGITENQPGDDQASTKAMHTAEQLLLDEPVPSNLAYFIWAYTGLGNTDKAEQLMQQLKVMAMDTPVSALTWYIAYLRVGDQEQALDWLHKAIDTRDTHGYAVRMMAKQRNIPELWDNPRFQEARRKVGFTD